MLSSLPRHSVWWYGIAHPASGISLPRGGSRVGLRIVLFEARLAFTHVMACTLALSPIRDPLSECFSHFVTSMTAPVAFRLKHLPCGIRNPWRAPPYQGAHPKRTLMVFCCVTLQAQNVLVEFRNGPIPLAVEPEAQREQDQLQAERAAAAGQVCGSCSSSRDARSLLAASHG